MFELGNNDSYEDEYWKGILVEAYFATHSRFNKNIQNHLTK